VLANAGVMDEFRERARRTEQLAGRKEEEAGEVDQLRDTLAEKKARRPEPPFINRFFFLRVACCIAAGAPVPAVRVGGITNGEERSAWVRTRTIFACGARVLHGRCACKAHTPPSGGIFMGPARAARSAMRARPRAGPLAAGAAAHRGRHQRRLCTQHAHAALRWRGGARALMLWTQVCSALAAPPLLRRAGPLASCAGLHVDPTAPGARPPRPCCAVRAGPLRVRTPRGSRPAGKTAAPHGELHGALRENLGVASAAQLGGPHLAAHIMAGLQGHLRHLPAQSEHCS